jgi:recombination protein RecT
MTTTVSKELTRTADAQIPAAIRQIRADLNSMEPQFSAALPPHIPAARFARVAMTALQNNPKLLRCDRQSLFNALMRCAQDGLLPDGREAAVVPYGADDEGRSSADTAQYLPMIAGIRKKVRNSGALADWNVQVVQEGDDFAFELGDNPFIHHRPASTGGRARKVVAAYSIATYPDGTVSREVMNADQIADIQRKSKARKGPWSDPVFYPEMARKTVAKLHSKQLPMSTDLDRVLHRDDELYNFAGAAADAKQVSRPGSAAAALEWFANGDEGKPEAAEASSTPAEAPRALPGAAPLPAALKAATTAASDGPTTTSAPPPGAPTTEDEYRVYARAIIDEAASVEVLETWFRSEHQRKLRNAAGVTREVFELVDGWVKSRARELGP